MKKAAKISVSIIVFSLLLMAGYAFATCSATNRAACLAPISPANTTIKFEGQATNSSSLTAPQVSMLVPCPTDPSQINPNILAAAANIASTLAQSYNMSYTATLNQQLATFFQQSPYYSDIEGKTPSGVALPDQCTVTSVVVYNEGGGQAAFTPPTATVITAITATCPDGYVQVGVAPVNNNPSVIPSVIPQVYYNSTSSSVYPATIDQLNNYVAEGYNCTNDTNISDPNGFVPGQQSQCDWSNNNIPPGLTLTFNVPINTPYNATAGSSTLSNDTSSSISTGGSGAFPKTGVIKFYNISAPNSQCYWHTNSSCNSGTQLAGCAPNCSIDYAGTNASVSCNNPVGFAQNAYYQYYYQICSISAGYVKTANEVPATIVCARIKSQYNKMN